MVVGGVDGRGPGGGSVSQLRWEFIKENKKVRKQELDQGSDQEKKVFSFFLGRFLGQVLVFLFS